LIDLGVDSQPRSEFTSAKDIQGMLSEKRTSLPRTDGGGDRQGKGRVKVDRPPRSPPSFVILKNDQRGRWRGGRSLGQRKRAHKGVFFLFYLGGFVLVWGGGGWWGGREERPGALSATGEKNEALRRVNP